MIDKLKETFNQASEIIKQQTSNIGDAAKEKSQKIIDDWLKVFLQLEEYGFKITSFGLSVALSPSLEVELEGSADTFSLDRVKELIEENQGNSSLTSVFKTIKTTYELHAKISKQEYEVVNEMNEDHVGLEEEIEDMLELEDDSAYRDSLQNRQIIVFLSLIQMYRSSCFTSIYTNLKLYTLTDRCIENNVNHILS